MSEMICPRCGTKMHVRKSKRAAYKAPEIHICLQCSYTAVKHGDEIKPLDNGRK